jgi:hypothetical protein
MASTASIYLGKPLGQHNRSAEELCNGLLIHMLECDQCLDPDDSACRMFGNLQGKIVANGGARTAAVYAI